MDEWKNAKSPNYETNKDKLYPYSEMPFQNEYKLVKIPFCIKNLIEHVDYFGCGRIEFTEGNMGFSDCYNVNYEFRLVSEDPDKQRKIPNRIPMSDGTSFGSSTRNYIKDNSVHTVTVNLLNEDMTELIAIDIARIVNSKQGKVIVYLEGDVEIERLANELKTMKQLLYCPNYILPDKLHLTFWNNCYKAYLSINELKRKLYLDVNKGDIEAAVVLTGCLNNIYCGDALTDVVNKVLANKVGNVFVYAYKLWHSDKEVVREHFPSVFKHIFDGDCMAIINSQNNQALLLEPKTKARGDGHYKSSNKSGWKIIPIWDNKKLLFKLYNVASDMYLQLSPTAAGEDGVSQASGSEDSEELSDKFYFEPLIMMNGQVAFNIFNDEDNKRLELPVGVDTSEVKAVVGHKSVDQDESFSWILTSSSQDREKSVKRDEQDQSEDEECAAYII